jgi:predicted hotdog family 3-hydroxylacyl-ACP dehydratase
MSASCSVGVGSVTPRVYPIEAVLPHRRPMILLDEIVDCDDATLVAAVSIRPTTLFLEDDSVPGHIGIEYMAQACGAFAGAEALRRGETVRIGFLLGSRRYIMHMPRFRLGDRLIVSVSLGYRDESMATFDGRIEVAGKLAAEARLTVYQPRVDGEDIGFDA